MKPSIFTLTFGSLERKRLHQSDECCRFLIDVHPERQVDQLSMWTYKTCWTLWAVWTRDYVLSPIFRRLPKHLKHPLEITKLYNINHHPFKGGTYPKCKPHFSKCFWRGPWKCKLTFWRYFDDPPHKNDTWGTFSGQIYIWGGVPKNVSYILVWSPLKSRLKGVMIIYILYTYIPGGLKTFWTVVLHVKSISSNFPIVFGNHA